MVPSPGCGPIYPRGPVKRSYEHADEPTTPIDGLSLRAYVDVCRALVRDGGDSVRRVDAVLAEHDLTPERWALVHGAWTARIRRDPDLRSEFQRLYACVGVRPTPGENE